VLGARALPPAHSLELRTREHPSRAHRGQIAHEHGRGRMLAPDQLTLQQGLERGVTRPTHRHRAVV
jgi:hypothetical protein